MTFLTCYYIKQTQRKYLFMLFFCFIDTATTEELIYYECVHAETISAVQTTSKVFPLKVIVHAHRQTHTSN